MIEATEVSAALGDAETDAVIDQAPDSPDVEALAIEAGWKPASEWKGDGHMPASAFLKHQVARAKENANEVKSVNKRLDKLTRTSGAILERALREQRDELEGKYADAVAANKPGEARKISQQIDALENQGNDDQSVVDDFKARNAWYGKDEDATAYADSVSIREAAKGKSYEDQLEAVEAAVKKRFPEYGEAAAARPKPVVVGAPAARSAPARAKGFTADTLPADAKKALSGYLARIPDAAKQTTFTKSYLEEYNKENGQ